jgi:molybdopterin molybdotransferase
VIPLEDARARVLAALPAPRAESRAVVDALGLVLAADVRSPSTVPPFDNSAMDGYAVRY